MKDVKAFILGVETQDRFTQSNAFYNNKNFPKDKIGKFQIRFV
jgi:hypothetical protein